jgi:hypothetical protein
VGVQEVRWEGDGTELTREHTFFYLKGNENHELGTGFFVHKRIIPAVKRVEFVSDRKSCIILRGRWCHITVLNVHAPTEDETDDVKDSFYEELERVLVKFLEHHLKILCYSRQGRHLELKIGNEGVHETRNYNGVRLVNFVTSKTLKSQKYDILTLHHQ